MSEDNVSQNIPSDNPMVENKSEGEVKPDKMGSQFAAIRRQKQEARALEAAAQQKLKQAEQIQSEYSELDKLSTDQILERIAAKRGKAPEDLIQDYVTKKIGAPKPEDIIKDSKDPAVQALYQKLAERDKILEELQKKLDEKSEAELNAQHAAAVQRVQNDCLAAASESWSDENDYPMFFADRNDLATSVYKFAQDQVNIYHTEHDQWPDEEDIKGLIKRAPAIILEQRLASPIGQRVAALKTQTAADKKKSGGVKPKLNVPSVVSPESSNNKAPTISTKFDRQGRLEAARKAFPSNARFPGQ